MGVTESLTPPPGIEPLPVWNPPDAGVVDLLVGAAAGTGTALVAPLVRRPLLRGIAHLLSQPGPRPGGSGSVSRRREAAAGDPGWFGPDSVAWRVHADPSILVAGMAAFMLQALHPLALAAVADNGSFAEDFAGRVLRTGEFLSGVVYGSSEEAAARCAAVRRVHHPVVGTAPDGRLYDANDPELLAWVHVGELLAIAAAYRRFGLHPLPAADLDRYVAEMAVAGEAVGVVDPPRSWAELDAAYQRFRPQLAVGEQTRSAMAYLRRPPRLPAGLLPVWGTVWSGGLACLPPSALRLLGVRAPAPAAVAACRSLVRSLAALLGPPPPLVAARARLAAGAGAGSGAGAAAGARV